jgi:hypothetical protein
MAVSYEGWLRSRESYRERRDRAFWTMVDIQDGCWVWTGARQTRRPNGLGGYGTLIRNGRLFYAHRYAYELVKGPIPSGLEILHACDNPPCINPAHLSVGTRSDNVRDMFIKGRHPFGPADLTFLNRANPRTKHYQGDR